MPPPPEEPTRPLRPAEPVYEREVIAPVDDGYDALLDRIRSLRSALTIVGIIAVLALAAAAYSILTKEEESDTRAGASRERVARLADRVDQLESSVGDVVSKSDVSKLATDQQALSDRLDDVEAQAGSATEDTTDEDARATLDALGDDVQTLSDSVTDIDSRVGALEQQAQP